MNAYNYFGLILFFNLALGLHCPRFGTVSQNYWAIDFVVLSVNQYPSRFKTKYLIGPESVEVHICNSSSGIDSVLFRSEVDGDDFDYHSTGYKRFDAEVFSNTCIEDGMNMSLDYLSKGDTVKQFRFQNAPHPELDTLISFVNRFVNDESKIYYDHQRLNDLITKCKE